MPKQKDLKRRVRRRMAKTGESYTAARAQVIEKRPTQSPTTALPIPRDPARIAGMSEEALRTKTGRSWEEWVRLLDAGGAHALPHRDIARRLREEHGLDGWWSQSVTVGYERIRGLRDVGQRRDGSYEANKSKTVAVPVARLYRAWMARERGRWLPGIDLAIRKASPERTLRISWPDGTSLQVHFLAKGPHKSTVAVQHAGLESKRAMEDRKRFWHERLRALAELLCG